MEFDLFSEDILIPLIVFSSLVFAFKSLLTYLERRTLIRNNVDANLLVATKSKKFDTPPLYSSLKYGLFLIAIGLGLYFGQLSGGDIDNPLPFFIYTLLFGGLGLLVNFGILFTMKNKTQGA